jgi:hypothetical protein
MPPWIGPPERFLGVTLPLTLLLVRTDRVAVVVDHVVSYPSGFVLRLSIRGRPPLGVNVG